MPYRLKNSLLTALIATALVLGFRGLAEPVEAEPLPSMLQTPSEQAAFLLAVQLTALVIDAAVKSDRAESHDTPNQVEATVRAATTAARDATQRRVMRMPFYSFAARTSRSRES